MASEEGEAEACTNCLKSPDQDILRRGFKEKRDDQTENEIQAFAESAQLQNDVPAGKQIVQLRGDDPGRVEKRKINSKRQKKEEAETCRKCPRQSSCRRGVS